MYLVSWNVGGIANRLRCLVSVLRLAQRFDRIPLLCWPCNNHCRARFQDLFEFDVEQIDEEALRASLQVQVTGGAHFGFPHRSKLCALRNSNAPFIILKDCYKWVLDADEVTADLEAGQYNEDWLRMPNAARRELQSMLHWLLPVDTIAGEVARFCHTVFGAHRVVGVHARKTDKLRGRSSVSVKAEEHALRATIDRVFNEDPEQRVFLCSDSAQTEEECHMHFGDRCIIRKKREYDTQCDTEGIDRPTVAVQKGLTDLLILARTIRILGTHNSTFSSLAACYYDVPYTRLLTA